MTLTTLAYNADFAVFSLSAAFPVAIAAGANYVEHTAKHEAVKQGAAFAKYAFTVLSAFTALPVVVYSIFKAAILKLVGTLYKGNNANVAQWSIQATLRRDQILATYSNLVFALFFANAKSLFDTVKLNAEGELSNNAGAQFANKPLSAPGAYAILCRQAMIVITQDVVDKTRTLFTPHTA